MAAPYQNPYYQSPYGAGGYMQNNMPVPYPAPQHPMNMQPYQQQQMQQQVQNNQQMQPMQTGQPVQGISAMSRPVTNIEEARAVAADFSGSPMIFPDISHNRVYVKRWDINAGVANFTEYAPVVYAPAQQPVEAQVVEQSNVEFATIDNLYNVQDSVENLQKMVDSLKSEVDRLKRNNASQNTSRPPVAKKKDVKDDTDE